jgi:hypothetical protein
MKEFNVRRNGHKSCVRYSADINVFHLANILAYKLINEGLASSVQRIVNQTRVMKIAKSVVGRGARDEQRIRRDARETGASDVITKFNLGYWSFTIAISSKMLKHNKATGETVVLIPTNPAEIAKYASEFDFIDGQHRVLSFHEAFCMLDKTIVSDGITFNCELMVDATEEQKRDEFLRANADNVKVQSVLNDRLTAENHYLDPDRQFAYDVIDQIASQRFLVSNEIGFVHSEIYGNIDCGRGEGTYKAQKLAKAMCCNNSNLYSYYVNKYKHMEYNQLVAVAATDMAKILFGWTLVNSAANHNGTSYIFGNPKKKKVSSNTRINVKNIREVDDNAKSGKGLTHYNVHYIFGTAAAVIKAASNGEVVSIEDVRTVIEKLYSIRKMTRLEDGALSGHGGSDIFNKIAADAKKLNNMTTNTNSNEGKFATCV